MPNDYLKLVEKSIETYVVPLGWKVLSAVLVWLIGSWVIKLLRAALGRTMLARKVDTTLAKYAQASADVLLKLLLFVALLSVLGVETTSFAALLAAMGVAIGMAWSGLLSNFAAGMFLMLLRPFKVGDMISAAGVVGDVKEIGLFVTAIDMVDNVRVYVGNGKLFSESISNFSTNPFRRVDLKAQLAHGVNPYDAIQRIFERVSKIANVSTAPAPSVEILEFNAMGTLLAVRPYCDNRHYWQVYFETNKAISDVCGEAGYAVPETRVALRKLEPA